MSDRWGVPAGTRFARASPLQFTARDWSKQIVKLGASCLGSKVSHFLLIEYNCTSNRSSLLLVDVAEWLRRRTANPLVFYRECSNHFVNGNRACAHIFFCRNQERRQELLQEELAREKVRQGLTSLSPRCRVKSSTVHTRRWGLLSVLQSSGLCLLIRTVTLSNPAFPQLHLNCISSSQSLRGSFFAPLEANDW